MDRTNRGGLRDLFRGDLVALQVLVRFTNLLQDAVNRWLLRVRQ